MAKEKEQPVAVLVEKTDDMDGAQLPPGKRPEDFAPGKDGRRHNEDKKPWGKVQVNLSNGVFAATSIPPRSIWKNGHWKGTESKNGDWNTWVVSGEGTPGNYKTREYLLPDEVCALAIPDHPADWSENLRKARTYSGYGSYSASSGLPSGVRIRCPGCGHFYRVDDIPNHKEACPANQDPVMWVIECECHKGDLQTAATVLPGFPVKPPTPKEAASENGGSAQPASEASATA